LLIFRQWLVLTLSRYSDIRKSINCILSTMPEIHHKLSMARPTVLIGSASARDRYGLKPRAKIRGWASIGSEPTIMLTGPVEATHRALAKAGLGIGDIDLWELNEAFASVVLHFMEQTGVDHSRMNVNGGAIAMGHPLGATGAMILGMLIDELERSNKLFGIATLCAASGQAIAMVVERV
jgi:acetyl-CoA C-acetyltransferase